jgi:PAS domain S-box-containing protein
VLSSPTTAAHDDAAQQREGAGKLSPAVLQRLRDAGACLLVGAIYFALAWLSTRMTPRAGDLAYLWPAGGFILGILLVAPRRLWLPFALSGFLADVIHAETVTHALQKSLGYAGAYFACLLLASFTLRRLVQPHVRLDSMRRLILFVLIAPIGGNVLAAASGAFVSMAFGEESFLQTFRVWWISDALGILLIAPFVVAWSNFRATALAKITRGRGAAEALICFAGLAVVAHWAFSAQPVPGGGVPPLTHFIIPFLVWAALRFGTRGQSAAMILLSGISVYDTIRGLGPFSAAFVHPDLSVLYLQMFLIVAAVMTLIGSALMRERLVAQRNAEEWKLRYEAAVVSAGNVLYDMDLRTREVVWGGNTRQILGFDPREVRDASAWLARVHPNELGKIEKHMNAAAAGNHETRTLEYRVVRENGAYIDVEDTGRVVRLSRGRTVRAIGFLKDVTERNRAAVERARADSEKREAQKMEALGTMAGGIAHDFNNILGAILGYSELVAAELPAGSKQRQQLNAIMDAGKRGKALVDQILTYARRGTRDKRAIELWPVMREVRDLLAASTPEGVTIRLEVDDPRGAVMADATHIHQLLMNLSTNAVHAMAAGGQLTIGLATEKVAERRVLTRGELQPGTYVALSVRDTGTGIAPEVAERMFEPFYTTKGTGQGTGLGLALVESIAKDHGGAVEVQTKVGAGTLFKVYLPAAPESVAEEQRREVQTPRGKGETVLLVDDDRAVLAMAEDMLAQLGYEPVGYDSSTQALEAFRARPERFDAVLADELMPDLSGTQLATRVRELRPGVPVVIASGYGGPELRNRARDAGVAQVIDKPYESSGLAQALAMALKGNGSGG